MKININDFISKYTWGKPHIKCVTYQQLWLNRMLLFVATANKGLSKNLRRIGSYIFLHLESSKWSANNTQILDGINKSGTHHISLRTLERAISNLSYIIWEDNDAPLISKHRFGKYGKYTEWSLNSLLQIKHNPNDKVIVYSYRIKPKLLKVMKLRSKLILVENKSIRINREKNSIKWAIQQM